MPCAYMVSSFKDHADIFFFLSFSPLLLILWKRLYNNILELKIDIVFFHIFDGAKIYELIQRTW